MKLWKVRTYFIAKEVFQYSLVAYLILLLAETIKQGLVSFFFDLNYLLAVVLVSGVVMVATHNEKLDKAIKTEKHHKIKISDILYIIILAVGGGFLVFYKTNDLGFLSLLISGFTTVIIILLSFLILFDKD